MKRLAVFAVLVLFAFGSLAGQLVFISSESITPNASTGLTVPSNARTAIIHVRTAGVHVDMAGTAATTSDPYWPPGVYMFEDLRSLFVNFKFITSSDGTAVVTVDYLR